ncbi:MAG: winged helix-turn-helix domain-containing protein [Acidobacteria bacterium]|nr:winged helix-turn-helix domain-containing protein [Acidobacteriota bacterium]
MAAPPSSSRRQPGLARFGVFEADLETRELRKQGRRVRLQDQPFAVLVLLLERAGTLVSREEVRERLWPSDTYVDFDHGLNTAINKLRAVLGDSATSPRFIETLARRGYRFLGNVDWQMQSKDAIARDELSSMRARGPQPSPALDIPEPHRNIPRSLFAVLQLMYLIFYLEALFHWENLGGVTFLGFAGPSMMVSVLVLAALGIPVRFYFLSAVGFDYARFGEKFHRIFLAIFLLDELWALAPFLLVEKLGLGPTLAATAALLYVPFAERTLVRMAYRQPGRTPNGRSAG